MALSNLIHVGLQDFSHHINLKIHRKILSNRQIMRLMIIIMVFSVIYMVSAKSTNVKRLTESLGQEVIEIGTPIKELPIGLEEEPSASAEDESDEDEKASLKTTDNTTAPAKKDVKKATTQTIIKKDVKVVEKIEGLNPDEDEERIEKELSEIYKDTADYKADSAEEKEVAKETETPAPEKVTEEETSAEETDSDKAIGRQRGSFKLQPDSTDKASIEKFRTSVDEISCNNRKKLKAESTQAGSSVTPKPGDDAFRVISDGILVITAVLSYVFVCS